MLLDVKRWSGLTFIASSLFPRSYFGWGTMRR